MNMDALYAIAAAPFFAAAWFISILAVVFETVAGWVADAGDLLAVGRWGASRPENDQKQGR